MHFVRAQIVLRAPPFDNNDNNDNTMKETYYIGLDVHKKTVAIAHALGGGREDATYHGTCKGSVLTVERALRKLAKKLGVGFKDLNVCYEAGPAGFVLQRHLQSCGLECAVMAPTKTTRKPGEKVKTDKRDARKIAREFRNGDITEVHVPPPVTEAVRDVCRARTDAVDDVVRAKQRLKSFMLRNGYTYEGSASWSDSHMNYLRNLRLATHAHQIVLEEYIQAIDTGRERVDRLFAKMEELLDGWEWEPVVRGPMAFRGFRTVAAMTVTAELGDLRRFENPRKVMGYIGLVPDEDSSGPRRRQGAITKCGNGHARWMLVECAQHYAMKPKVGPALSARQKGVSARVRDLSWRTQDRLCNRYRRLMARGKRKHKVTIAIARELAAFVWELQNKCQLPMPEPQPYHTREGAAN